MYNKKWHIIHYMTNDVEKHSKVRYINFRVFLCKNLMKLSKK